MHHIKIAATSQVVNKYSNVNVTITTIFQIRTACSSADEPQKLNTHSLSHVSDEKNTRTTTVMTQSAHHNRERPLTS